MNKKTVKQVERRLLQKMMEDEKALKEMLAVETDGIPYGQLDGLMVKIEQLLGRIMINQNKLMLLQDIVWHICHNSDIFVTSFQSPASSDKGLATGKSAILRQDHEPIGF